MAAVDAVLPALNELLDRQRLLGAYLYAHTSTDARDADAARLQSRLQADMAGLATLSKRLEAWVATVGARRAGRAQHRGGRPRLPAAAGASGPPPTR